MFKKFYISRVFFNAVILHWLMSQASAYQLLEFWNVLSIAQVIYAEGTRLLWQVYSYP
jgi:hypothetical protein